MKRKSVVCFCMPEEGHLRRMLPLVKGLAARGLALTVLTDRRFADDVAHAGGIFQDLFAEYPLEAADSESMPIPCRYVSYAGTYLDEVIKLIRRLNPSLVVYDTFSVVAPLASRDLRLPHVNICAGHNVEPTRFVKRLQTDPRVALSNQCLEAVLRLRDRFGDLDLSPFSYVSPLSPNLNLYCEPPEFLDGSLRPIFEPIAFLGALLERPERVAEDPSVFGDAPDGTLRIYASFGTVIWRYYREEALQALRALSGAVRQRPEILLLIGLGRAKLSAGELVSLAGDGIRIEPYVDQARVLSQADLFVTHHGLNSTHEAIVREVPMLSYPFFWDQPLLAKKCQQLDLAVALGQSPRAPLDEATVLDALDTMRSRRTSLRAGLSRAAQWEVDVLEARDLVFDKIEELL